MDWQYTNDRSVQLEWGYPHSSRRCRLAVPPALALTLPSARPQAVLVHSRVDLVLAVQPARATLSMQVWQCFPHVPRRCLAHVQRCLTGKRFSPVLALLLAGALTVSHTRHDVDSPASVSRPWWWAHCGAAAIVQSSRVHVSIAILASDGGLKLLVELHH